MWCAGLRPSTSVMLQLPVRVTCCVPDPPAVPAAFLAGVLGSQQLQHLGFGQGDYLPQMPQHLAPCLVPNVRQVNLSRGRKTGEGGRGVRAQGRATAQMAARDWALAFSSLKL